MSQVTGSKLKSTVVTILIIAAVVAVILYFLNSMPADLEISGGH